VTFAIQVLDLYNE